MRKPHTLTVNLPTAVIESNVLLGYSNSAQGTVRGQMQPETASVVMEQFGVEPSRPWLFYCSAEDADKFAEGGDCTWDGKTFNVAAAPKAPTGFNKADHCVVALDEVA